MTENNLAIYVSVMQLAILTIGVVTVIVKLGKREALIESNAEELKQLKEITKDLVKADIENGKNILTVVGDLKALKYRVEMLESKWFATSGFCFWLDALQPKRYPPATITSKKKQCPFYAPPISR